MLHLRKIQIHQQAQDHMITEYISRNKCGERYNNVIQLTKKSTLTQLPPLVVHAQKTNTHTTMFVFRLQSPK